MTATETPIAGAILLGGRSLRMGRDKANLKLAGKTLLERAVEALLPVVEPLYLVGSAHSHTRAITLQDIYPGLGPLGGIYSALFTSPAPHVCVLAVDTPLVKTDTLRKLIEVARLVDIAVMRTHDGRVHPLCGVYSKRCLGPLRNLVETEHLRVDGLFRQPQLQVQIVESSTLGCLPQELTNINTPADLQVARQWLQD